MDTAAKELEVNAAVKEFQDIADPLSRLLLNVENLSAFGGVSLISSLIDGTSDLDPASKARRNILLTDVTKQASRDSLETALTAWAEMLEKFEDAPSMARHCEEQLNLYEATYTTNLLKVVEESKKLEQSYRNVELFFDNAGAGKLKNVSFVNCDPQQIRDIEEPRFSDAVKEELNMNYDRLDLGNNYSILVLPGYLGPNTVLDKWSGIAHDHKAMLITDFENVDAPDDLMELFDTADHTSGDVHKSNVIMTCNWLVGRGRYEELHEEDDLYVPPSGALAGKIYGTLMSQVAAGKKFGIINGTDGVKFDLKKSEIANLEKMGLVPMVKENSKVMAFSAKTLFNGDNLGLQTYSVVRVFDYVTKVLIDFLNRRAFENFNANTRKDLMAQIVKFLDSITGPERLIEDFTIKRFEQDSVQKDKIHVDIHMKPYFPAKNFMIKMEGQRGDESTSWSTSYDQQVS